MDQSTSREAVDMSRGPSMHSVGAIITSRGHLKGFHIILHLPIGEEVVLFCHANNDHQNLLQGTLVVDCPLCLPWSLNSNCQRQFGLSLSCTSLAQIGHHLHVFMLLLLLSCSNFSVCLKLLILPQCHL